MPDNKMLIDATHPEETRVVVLRGGRVEEFDYESAARKQLRGNIYLAKVTRVEPALQAAFVDYGGNRHGFLAFNEIHPDYYQIPMADRQALLDEEAAAEAAEEAAADARAEALARRQASRAAAADPGREAGEDDAADEVVEAGVDALAERDEDHDHVEDDDDDADDEVFEVVEIIGAGSGDELPPASTASDDGSEPTADDTDHGPDADDADADASGDADEPPPGRPRRRRGRGGPSSMAQAMARDPSLSEDESVARERAAEASDAGAAEQAPERFPATPADAEPPLHAGTEAEADTSADEPRSGDDRRHADDTEPYAAGDDEDEDGASADAGPAAGEAGHRREARHGGHQGRHGGRRRGRRGQGSPAPSSGDGEKAGEGASLEMVGSEDALEELPARSRRTRRSYKIQEVIKRRQVMLIQVVKEERGNKGAALTTYLSLAGRYTVLMPNTARGGGISRKITNPQDRKRLKAIAAELDVPEGMGLIIRTAGAARTKQEIRRDFEYLLRLWESVRDLTLRSTAPSLVYEEGDLIKRSIRDLYNKDIDEVVVAGDAAFQEARAFMRMLMPSHAKNVIAYQEREPLFTRYQIERQLNAMFSPYVNLKSGGYLVINQTEALVAVDVNSGRSTREYSIEETALHTNLEAADEIARQLKLRDLAGLIVIDFIDMEEKRNNRNVERRLKDALRFDRARIQVGRISPFGLMEMSRQRLRTGVLEGSTSQCPHCQGTGIIRSTESVALAVLRGLEDAVMAKQRGSLIASTTAEVALYILNNKRDFIVDMEARQGYPIIVQASAKLAGANFTIERGNAPPQAPRHVERGAVSMDWGFDEATEDGAAAEAEDMELAQSGDTAGDVGGSADEAGGEDDPGRRKRRRRRRNRREGGEGGGLGARHERVDAGESTSAADLDDGEDAEPEADGDAGDESAGGPVATAEEEDGRATRRRRRGRRGGRRNRERSRGEDGDVAARGPRDDVEPGHDLDDDDDAVPAVDAGSEAYPPPTENGARPSRHRAERAAERVSSHAGAQPGEASIHVDSAEVDEPDTEAPLAAAEVAAPAAAMPARRRDGDGDGGPDDASASMAAQTSAPDSGEPVRRHRGEPVSSAPRIERVKVGPGIDDAAGEPVSDAASTTTAAPSRRGWWQKKLLGG
ncbi:MAG: Rne/Rng family ribonuclease [Hyphomicrobiaceae bacterium]|nr:Rne/Rng family ribonuclease [Hyphomicrobiaceae bacterium]